MKKYILIGLTVFFLYPQLALADNHFQYINTNCVSVGLTDKLSLNAEAEFGLTNDMRKFFYQHTEAGIEYAAYSCLDLAYRQIWEREETRWEWEDRPHINAKIKWQWNPFELSNRSRFEFRHRPNKEDNWRYRNETSIEWPVPTGKSRWLF